MESPTAKNNGRTLRSSTRKRPIAPLPSRAALATAPDQHTTTTAEESSGAAGLSPQHSASTGCESSVPTPATSILPAPTPAANNPAAQVENGSGADESEEEVEKVLAGEGLTRKRRAGGGKQKTAKSATGRGTAAVASPKRLRSGRSSHAGANDPTSVAEAEPSSKSLGKRRARSSSPAPGSTDPPISASDQSSKRRKRNHPLAAGEGPSSYNLRSRPTSTTEPSTTALAPSSKVPSRKKGGKGKGKAEAELSPPPEGPTPSTSRPANMPRDRRPRGGAKSTAAAAKERAALAHPVPSASTSADAAPAQSGSNYAPEPVKEPAPAAEEGQDPDGDVRMEVASPLAVGGLGDDGPGQAVFEETEHDTEDEDDEDDGGDGEGNDDGSGGSQSEHSHTESEEMEDSHDDDEDADDYGDGGAVYAGESDAPRRHSLGGPDSAIADGGDAFGDPPPPSRGDALAAMGAMNALGSLGFGGLGGLSGLMSGLTSRLKAILASLRTKGSAQASTDRLVALQELAEILAVSTEDTLAGYFQTDSFAKELVSILKGGEGTGEGSGGNRRGEGDGGDGEEDEEGEGRGEGGEDEDAAMAAALAASMGEDYGGAGAGVGGGANDREVEHMMLASRCLANLMEALPGASHTVVMHGAVPVLCAKLLEIQFIDLAEQCLSTLEKISEEMPGAIVREGGLTAILQYLDFFSTNVQRTAVTAAANCCRGISPDSFSQLKEPFATLRNVVSYPDQRVAEQAVLAITRVMDAYRGYNDKLATLVTSDVLGALMALLSPAGGAKISDTIFTSILKSFTNIARGSPEMAASLMDTGLADAAFGILVGQTPPETKDETALAKELTENTTTITQALMRRDKAHIQQTLDLIVEVLPTLPKDGVFDSKLGKRKKSAEAIRIKREEVTPALPSGSIDPPVSTSAGFGLGEEALSAEPLRVKKEGTIDDTPDASRSVSTSLAPPRLRDPTREANNARRIELLNLPSRDAISRRFHALLLPTLLDVYGASVSSLLRQKALNAMLKIAHFSQAEHLANVLRPVPMASFLASILANRDQPSLVVSALQMSDLLLRKLPEDYHFFFRREGVMHEIERMANQPLHSTTSKTDRQQTEAAATDLSASVSTIGPPGSGTSAVSSTEAASRDSLTLRAQHVRDHHAANETEASKKAQHLLETTRQLADSLRSAASVEDARKALEQLAAAFVVTESPISSFELAESGLVKALLSFATDSNTRRPDLETRKALLSDLFIAASTGTSSEAPFVPLVKRLQESLSRLENFDVRTASGSGSDDARKGSASLLSRQIKFRLTAVDPQDIPSSCRDVVIAIHAIAKLDAIDKYIRPRIIKSKDDERFKSAPSSSSRLAGGVPGSPTPTGGSLDPLAGPGEGEALTSAAASTPQAGPSRSPRRSSRLSARRPTGEGLQDPAPPPADDGGDGLLEDSMDLDTPEISASGFAAAVEEATGGGPVEDPLVNVQPTGDGSRVEASTPHGTRIATPQGSRPASAMGGLGGSALSALLGRTAVASSSRLSYASALKAAPKDWHLEYFIGDQRVSLESTVYGAVVNCDPSFVNGIRSPWNTIHTLTFKRVAGPDQSEGGNDSTVDSGASQTTPCVADGSQQSSILRLLRAIHNLHLDWKEFRRVGHDASMHAGQIDETLFINNKLTAKLNRQLEEPMIVASNCLPAWANELPMEFHFLFPFETRFAFLQSTAFGYPRLIQKWLNQARSSSNSSSSRNDDLLGYLGKLPRQKVRVSRSKVLESLEKILAMYAKSQALLEIEYFDEVGTGLGPTLEFFSLASTAFMEKQLSMWRDHTTDSPSPYVFSLAGLFPAPLSDALAATPSGQRQLKMFSLLGQFVAKALMDSRIVDISFSRIFARLILGYDVPLTIRSVRAVDKSLASSLEHLQGYADAKAEILASSDDPEEMHKRLQEFKVDAATLEDLALDFILPGCDIELAPGLGEIPVTMDNVEEYIRLVIEWTLVKGVEKQIEAFKKGFSTIFEVRDLRSFTPEELVNIFGNTDNEDWEADTITASIRPDHGFNVDSPAVRDLISIMSAFSAADRRTFLQFITGAPKLPVGGFRGLHPPLTVVRKAPESGRPADEQLPSVMTCVNYLKLPIYSSRAVAESKIRTAMKEGADSFHLS